MCAEKWRDIAPLALRVVTGVLFMAHGYQKLTEITITKFGGFLGSVGIPFPLFFAPVVTYVELIGGIMLIFGFMTHWVSKLLALIMLVAVVMVHLDKGVFVAKGGYELALLLFVAVFSLMITGAGKWSVDYLLAKKKN
ncbi:MAG: DoxX family protein [Patescibacteria group bacterium]